MASSHVHISSSTSSSGGASATCCSAASGCCDVAANNTIHVPLHHSSKPVVYDASVLEMGLHNSSTSTPTPTPTLTLMKHPHCGPPGGGGDGGGGNKQSTLMPPATFAIESKGTWMHAAYHLSSATAGPPLLSLPYAMAALGWGPGMAALALGAILTFYSSFSLSRVMEHMEARDKRSLRFCDLSFHVIGPRLTYYIIAPLQLTVCYLVVIGGTVLGGQTMKEMYHTYNEEGSLQLYIFISFFGILVLLLAQIPSMHALRHFNMVSILLCFTYSICAVAGSLIAGFSKEVLPHDYMVQGTEVNKIFGIFTALAVMMTSYSNPLVVEIQATMAEPVGLKMVKGLGVCYGVAVLTFFPVAASGYWAFGSKAEGVILLNMLHGGGAGPLIPRSLYFTANACACLQLIVYTVIHLHPTFERLEAAVADPKSPKFSPRNSATRLASRLAFVVLATLLAAMLPFFVEFSAFMGAVGFTPICVFLPLLFYNIVFKPSIRSLTFWVNYLVMSGAAAIMLLGSISSLRQIVSEATTYRLFANV